MTSNPQVLGSEWERLGQDDPLWAIMPYPAEKSADWDVAEFMATGVADVAWVGRLLAAQSLEIGRRVLDFGCGVGRLTNALAELAPASEVTGVDIASSMVRRARELNRHPDRVRFEPYDGHRLPFADGSVDTAVSLVVVQHAPPAAQLQYLLELNRVVADGGAVVVQVVTEPRLPEPVPAAACRPSFEVLAAPRSLRPGGAATVGVRLRNDGEQLWPAGRRLRLGNHWLADGAMVVRDDGRTELPADLAPGESVELQLAVRAPLQPGRYQLELDVVQELVAWWSDLGGQTVRVDVDVSGEPAPATETDDPTRGVQMHATPDAVLRAVFTHCGSTVLSATADHFSDGHWDSITYVVRVGH